MKKLKIVLTIVICILLFLSGCAGAKASKEGNQDKKQEKDALTIHIGFLMKIIVFSGIRTGMKKMTITMAEYINYTEVKLLWIL